MSEVERIVKGRGFSYRHLPTKKTVKKHELRKWIESLAIPPAWKNVRIELSKSAKVLAWGRDEKNRKQYIYSPEWIKKRERIKFARMVSFGESLTKMRRVTGQHLREEGPTRERVLACMVRLLDTAYFRPGSHRYSDENDTYGLTTMRGRHLDIENARLKFSYVGKSGQKQQKVVEDERLVEAVEEISELPGYEIFQYLDEGGEKVNVTARILNSYIHEVMGDEFTAKDFRTWAGTYLAAEATDELIDQDQPKSFEKKQIAAIDRVATILGNTRSVAKANYINPVIFKKFKEGRTIRHYFKEAATELENDDACSVEEKALLALLKERS
ncbi:hypothetical protein N9D31_02180 [Oligoflexaceae bacterium]|nr:hypothetical protein [Oligoflexaceae bacterium]